MIVCLAIFNNRLAAVFDSADRFALYQVQDMQACHISTVSAADLSLAEKTKALTSNSVSLLVCGALCGCDRRVLQQAGIGVEAWVCGTTNDVVHALCLDQLDALRMPGCAPARCHSPGCTPPGCSPRDEEGGSGKRRRANSMETGRSPAENRRDGVCDGSGRATRRTNQGKDNSTR